MSKCMYETGTRQENMDDYIKHMHRIGWFQRPPCEEKNSYLYPGNFREKVIDWMNERIKD